jgi:hypothetical protein
MSRARTRFLVRACVGASLVPLLLLASGCGKSTGNVSGKVSYKGAPVKAGNVALINAAGKSVASTEINEDGTYSIQKVEAGDYKVCVDTSRFAPPSAMETGMAPGAKGAPSVPKGKGAPPPGAEMPEGYKASNPADMAAAGNAKRYTKIPEGYKDPAKTDLTVKVNSGDNPFDITLR